VKSKRALLVAPVILFSLGVWIQQGMPNIDRETVMGVWLFDEATGETVEDSSGNGNTGKIVGAKRVEGKEGRGVEFDGSNHMVIPASETTDDFLDGFTYLLWVKPLGVPAGAHIRLIERDWHNPNILIGPNDFYGSVLFNGIIDNSQIRGGTWVLGEWSFVALTHDGERLTLYVDGEITGEVEVGKPSFTQNNDGGSIWLARWKGGAGWDFTGVLDEVAIFNVPLTEDDLNTVMTAGLEKALAVSPHNRLTTTWGNIKQ